MAAQVEVPLVDPSIFLERWVPSLERCMDTEWDFLLVVASQCCCVFGCRNCCCVFLVNIHDFHVVCAVCCDCCLVWVVVVRLMVCLTFVMFPNVFTNCWLVDKQNFIGVVHPPTSYCCCCSRRYFWCWDSLVDRRKPFAAEPHPQHSLDFNELCTKTFPTVLEN